MRGPPLECLASGGFFVARIFIISVGSLWWNSFAPFSYSRVEQELLARIVSEMNQPVPDPTLPARRTEATPDSSVVPDDGATEDADMLGTWSPST